MTPAWRAALVLALVVVAAGVWGVAVSAGEDVTAASGALLGSADLELRLMTYNLLGALVTLATGAVALVAVGLRLRLLLVVAAVLGGTAVVQVLVQWGRGGGNLFGAVGANLSFGVVVLAGFGTLAYAVGLEAAAAVSRPPAGAAEPGRTR